MTRISENPALTGAIRPAWIPPQRHPGTRGYRRELLAAVCLLTLGIPNHAGAAGPGRLDDRSQTVPAASASQPGPAGGLFGASHSGLFAESEAAPKPTAAARHGRFALPPPPSAAQPQTNPSG